MNSLVLPIDEAHFIQAELVNNIFICQTLGSLVKLVKALVKIILQGLNLRLYS